LGLRLGTVGTNYIAYKDATIVHSSGSLLALRNSNFKKNKEKNVEEEKKNLNPQKKKKTLLLPRFLENPATISKGSVSCTGNQFCGQSKINVKYGKHGVSTTHNMTQSTNTT
jgi:hypothetical protein